MSGPPLGSTFSLSGRPAPGLYAAAWLLTFVGVGLFGVAVAAGLSGNATGAGAFAVAAFAALFVAAMLGSGYQALVRRATRDAAAYRGPSPFLVFAAVFAGASAVATLAALSGVLTGVPQEVSVLVSVAAIAALYAGLVWLLVVREGALSWAEMGWPSGSGRAMRSMADLASGAVASVPIVVVTIVLGGLLAAFFDVTPPALLPVPRTIDQWVLDIVVAVILAPFGEELFFRGFAQTAWARDLGPRRAIIRSALFFAFIHALSSTGADFGEGLRLAALAMAVRLPVALVLGWVFARTGSMPAVLGLHAGFNGLTLVAAALLGASLG